MARIVESEKPEVTVRPTRYYPSKEELEEDVSVDATPEQVRDTLMRSVIVKEAENA